MTTRIQLFTWANVGDAIILKENLVAAWRPRIRAALQQGSYRIIERPSGEEITMYWSGPPGVKLRKAERTSKHDTIAVEVLFSKVSDAVWFKLVEAYFLGGSLVENATRLDVDY